MSSTKAISFAGLDIHRVSLLMEAFGAQTCTEACPKTCAMCAEMRDNRERFFSQPHTSIVMTPPRVYRDVVVIAITPVTYCATITAYTAILYHIDRLCDPDNTGYIANDTWIREARPSRILAHALLMPKWKEFADEMEEVRMDPNATRLDILQTFERFICYGLAVMQVVNKHHAEMTLEDDLATLQVLTANTAQKLMEEKGSTAVAEWVDIAKADGYAIQLDYCVRMNKRHAEMMLQVEAERLGNTMRRMQLVLPPPMPMAPKVVEAEPKIVEEPHIEEEKHGEEEEEEEVATVPHTSE